MPAANGGANGHGTDGGLAVTSGGQSDSQSNGPRDPADDAPEIRRFRFPRWFWISYAAVLAIFAVVVGSSYWMEAGRVGLAIPAWHIAVNEITSIVIVYAVTPLVFAWSGRLDPRRIGWPRCLLGHGAGLVAFAAAHIGGMTLLRVLVYPLFGGRYSLGDVPLLTGLVYEFRKDTLAYAAMAAGAWLLAAALRRPTVVTLQAATPAPASRRLEIRDGAKRIFVDPAEILWAEAAGNYVELHLANGSHLQRQTLSTLEQQLAEQDFVRIHRSRIVNRRHVRSVAGNDSGDFTVTLDDGRQIGGGRRWREALKLS